VGRRSSSEYERIAIKENGERRVISKLEAVLKQLINKAATGDARAIRDVIKLQPLLAQHDQTEDEKVVVNIVRGRNRTTTAGKSQDAQPCYPDRSERQRKDNPPRLWILELPRRWSSNSRHNGT
jgi:hypothetical protein